MGEIIELEDDPIELEDAPAMLAKEIAPPSDQPPGGWGYQSLLIRQIRRDGGTQARLGLNEDTVQEYAELMREHRWDFQTMQRPIVLYDGDSFWLADGFHRIEAAQRAQLSDYPIEVLRGTQRDAILRAAGANSQHGLRRTNADKRRAVELLLRDEEWRQWSDRKIADVCAVSQPFVGGIRKEFASDNDYQMPTHRTVERNGSTYQMTPAAPKPADITDDERRIAALTGYVWEGSDLIPGKQAVYHFKSTNGVIDGTTMTRPQFDAWLKIHTPIERAPVSYQPTPPPIELPISTNDQAADDAAVVADIRALAEPLGLQMIWEDDRVVLYWPDEADDIEQMDLLSYGAALEWLKWEAVGIKQDRDAVAHADPVAAAPLSPAPAPDLAQLDSTLPADLHTAGYYWHSATPPTIAQNGSTWRGEAPTAALALDLARLRMDAKGEPIAVFPALNAMECKALIREAKVFIESGADRKLPTIGKILRIAARMALEATE